MRPGLIQPHIGAQLVLPGTTALAGVQRQVSSRERDLVTIEMVDQVRVSDQSWNLVKLCRYKRENFFFKL